MGARCGSNLLWTIIEARQTIATGGSDEQVTWDNFPAKSSLATPASAATCEGATLSVTNGNGVSGTTVGVVGSCVATACGVEADDSRFTANSVSRLVV